MPRTTVDKVNAPNIAHRKMSKKWDLIRDLKGGTLAMRKAEQRWLPREDGEETAAYENRLKRSFLFEAYKDTLDSISSRPFAKPIVISEEDLLPERLAPLVTAADARGKSLDFVARDIFKDGIDYGVVHIFVDAPKTGGNLNAAQERNVRPYFTTITAEALLGWKMARNEDGKLVLTEVRWKSSRIEDVGEFGEKEIEIVRVFKAPEMDALGRFVGQGTWRDYREKTEDKNAELPTVSTKGEDQSSHASEGLISNKTFVPEGESRTHSYPGVPMVTFYTNKTGDLTGEPALEGLAWKNIEHWQGASDQNNILRYARIFTMVASGVDPDKDLKNVTIGPNQIIKLKSAEAKVTILEHSGNAIKAGDEHQTKIEAQLEVLGLQPFMRKTGTQTATGRAIDESRQRSQIQCWIADFEIVLRQAFDVAATWVKEEIPDEVKFNLFSDFGISLRAEQNIKILVDLWKNNGLSHQTMIEELQRYAVLSEMVNADAEKTRLEEELEKSLENAVANAEAMAAIGDDDDDDEEEEPGDE